MAAPDRVVLYGFMASGKTTIGRLLADRLGWIHLDLDDEIEREQGRTVAEIFDAEGEEAFRRMEAAVTPPLIAHTNAVITPGGGWITNPSLRELIPPGTLTVWLKVSPDEVVRRVQAARVHGDRPLLRGTDPAARVVELLARREPLYAAADVTIDTTGRPAADVAAELATIILDRR